MKVGRMEKGAIDGHISPLRIYDQFPEDQGRAATVIGVDVRFPHNRHEKIEIPVPKFKDIGYGLIFAKDGLFKMWYANGIRRFYILNSYEINGIRRKTCNPCCFIWQSPARFSYLYFLP